MKNCICIVCRYLEGKFIYPMSLIDARCLNQISSAKKSYSNQKFPQEIRN